MLQVTDQWFSKWAASPLWRDFEG